MQLLVRILLLASGRFCMWLTIEAKELHTHIANYTAKMGDCSWSLKAKKIIAGNFYLLRSKKFASSCPRLRANA